MKTRLDRIDALIREGYTLNKSWGFYPDLKTSPGKSVDIFGSLFRLAGPAGFPGLLFLPLGCLHTNQGVAIFLFIILFSLFDTILAIFFEPSTSVTSLLSLLTCYWYACMFPYLRYLAAKQNVNEISKTSSILIGFVLCLPALTPSLILAVATKTLVA